MAGKKKRNKSGINKSAADHAVGFIECLKHSKDPFAGQPFKLAAWQKRDIIRPLFGTLNPDGLRQYRVAYVEIPCKNGKALDVDTPIPTPDGWVRHGDILPGDIIFDGDGKPQKVIDVTEHYIGPCLELCFSDGSSIVAHENHEWETKRDWFTGKKHGQRGPMPLVETKTIADTLSCSSGHVHNIPVSNPIECVNADLPIHPYVLGVWLGDGHKNSARITSMDIEVINRIKKLGYPIKEYCDRGAAKGYSITDGDRTQNARNKSTQAKLKKLGVLNNKHIPMNYLRASVEKRMELLRGLIDTDGYVSRRGQVVFTNTNKRIIDGTLELIRSLGIKATVRKDRAMLYGKDCSPVWDIQFFVNPEFKISYIKRKQERLNSGKRRDSRMIVAANDVGKRLVNCIEVERGFYLAGESFIKTHNSTLAAAVALYMLMSDSEQGAEVYGAACDRYQAGIVFHEAASMIRQDQALMEACDIHSSIKRIVYRATNSFYQVLSADSYRAEGINASAVIFDELHTQKTRELYDVLRKRSSTRRQPLFFMITTAGWDRESICWKVHEYADKVQRGIIKNSQFFSYMKSLPEDADWTDEKNWKAVNPGLGDFKSIESVRADYLEALEETHNQNSFRRYHLNQWTSAETRAIDMAEWAACAGDVDKVELAGCPCYGGLDLAEKVDMAAFVLNFNDEGVQKWLPFFWMPEENIRKRAIKEGAPYDMWAVEGHIKLTPGNVIDFAQIRKDINEIGKIYKIQEIAYDPWRATQLAIQLGEEDGFTMVEHRQGYKSMSESTIELLRRIKNQTFAHGNNPVLTWQADNLVVRKDPAGNIKPDKEKSSKKIDGIVAGIMAIGRAIVHTENEGRSIYEDRGLLSLEI